MNDSNTPPDDNERSLAERLWPDMHPARDASPNPHYGDLPLSYRLWPDTEWPPKQLYSLPSSPGVKHEVDRLFAEYYEREKAFWD
jgi:hypothetical protein